VVSWKSVAEPTADWKNRKDYTAGDEVLSYREVVQRGSDMEMRQRLDREIKATMREMEAKELEAERKEAEAASRARARELVPRTDKPFTDPDGRGGVLQLCAEPSCNAFPTKASGSWAFTIDRLWWCPEHRHLAGPEDHLPPVPTWIPRPGSVGGLMLNPESAEGRRVRAEAERQRQERQEGEEREREEAEALERVRENYRRTAVISVAGRPVHPDGRIVQ
jgi:hypothetical protein